VPSRQEIKILKLPYDSCTAALLWAAPLPPESPVPAILPFVTLFVGRCIVQSAAQRAVQRAPLVNYFYTGAMWESDAGVSHSLASLSNPLLLARARSVSCPPGSLTVWTVGLHSGLSPVRPMVCFVPGSEVDVGAVEGLHPESAHPLVSTARLSAHH